MQGKSLFPAELTADVPRITITGTQLIQIEQHKGLMAYQQEDIALMTGTGMLRIHGKALRFRLYSASEAIISGEIESVSLGEGGVR